MNKEEIIGSVNNAEFIGEGTPVWTFDQISEMMDQYAKQECIAFAEWAAVNGWYLNKIKRWSKRDDNSNSLVEVLAGSKSTEELYTLFLESIFLHRKRVPA